MSRGPGKVERRLRELLTDPSCNRTSLPELVREVFGLGYADPSEAQRVSVGRALRRVLAGNTEWRVREPKKGSPQKSLIREQPARASDAKIVVWAYRFESFVGVEWRTATILRRTRTRCTIDCNGSKITTDSSLKPIGEDRRWLFHGTKWRFEPVRSPEVESRVEAAYQLWRDTERGNYTLFGGGVNSGASPEAIAMLGLRSSFTRSDVHRAFREKALKAHPDKGGDPDFMRALVHARDAALEDALDDATPAGGKETVGEAEDDAVDAATHRVSVPKR